jgi:hypothetical protein
MAARLHGRYTYPATGGSSTVGNSPVALIGPVVVVVEPGAVVSGRLVVVDGAPDAEEVATTDVVAATTAERGSGSIPAQAHSTMAAVTTDVAPRRTTVRPSPG